MSGAEGKNYGLKPNNDGKTIRMPIVQSQATYSPTKARPAQVTPSESWSAVPAVQTSDVTVVFPRVDAPANASGQAYGYSSSGGWTPNDYVPNQASVVYAASEIKSGGSLGAWVGRILVAGIPVVGLVMLLVWAVKTNEDEQRAQWARAMLIWMAIGIVLSIGITALLVTLEASMYTSPTPAVLYDIELLNGVSAMLLAL